MVWRSSHKGRKQFDYPLDFLDVVSTVTIERLLVSPGYAPSKRLKKLEQGWEHQERSNMLWNLMLTELQTECVQFRSWFNSGHSEHVQSLTISGKHALNEDCVQKEEQHNKLDSKNTYRASEVNVQVHQPIASVQHTMFKEQKAPFGKQLHLEDCVLEKEQYGYNEGSKKAKCDAHSSSTTCVEALENFVKLQHSKLAGLPSQRGQDTLHKKNRKRKLKC